MLRQAGRDIWGNIFWKKPDHQWYDSPILSEESLEIKTYIFVSINETTSGLANLQTKSFLWETKTNSHELQFLLFFEFDFYLPFVCKHNRLTSQLKRESWEGVRMTATLATSRPRKRKNIRPQFWGSRRARRTQQFRFPKNYTSTASCSVVHR